jgi:prevent-host-death family protein
MSIIVHNYVHRGFSIADGHLTVKCGHMEKGTVGIRELKDKASSIIDRVEEGEAITVTKRGRPVARIVSVATPPHLAGLIAEGAVRPSEGPRYLPKPIKLRGGGKDAADYVAEGRR